MAGSRTWTNENRGRYDRSKLRYPSDLTEEWAAIAPLVPPAKRGGNKRTVDVREVVNGLMYILGTGCQWAALPKDLPPRSTVNDHFRRWDWDGTLGRIHHALYVRCRELGVSHSESAWAGCEASPTAAIVEPRGAPDIDSQSEGEKGGAASIRRATTRARRSGARSATSSWTPRGC